MKKFFIPFLFLPVFVLQAQTKYSFLYDEAGNCIRKYYTVVVQQQSAPSNANNPNPTAEMQESTQPQTDEIGDVAISVYPNPTAGILNITIAALKPPQEEFSDLPYQLVFLDFSGKVLFTKQVQNTDTQIDVSSYPSGTYVLCVRFAGKQSVWKIVKQ
jgi:hypothetical protein